MNIKYKISCWPQSYKNLMDKIGVLKQLWMDLFVIPFYNYRKCKASAPLSSRVQRWNNAYQQPYVYKWNIANFGKHICQHQHMVKFYSPRDLCDSLPNYSLCLLLSVLVVLKHEHDTEVCNCLKHFKPCCLCQSSEDSELKTVVL